MIIKVDYNPDAIWLGADPDDLGYDKEASEAMFERLVQDQFKSIFPECIVTCAPGKSCRVTTIISDDGHVDMSFDNAFAISLIDRAWCSDWQVEEC